jgi:hypothetical protein
MTTPLLELYERVRSLEAEPVDIDALLVAMDRPVVPGESVRSRADVLLRIIDNPVIRRLHGADQRRVDETAVHALLALGEPYARELSAHGRKLLDNQAPRPPRRVPVEKKPEARDDSGGHVRSVGDRILGGVAVVCSLGEILSTFLLTEPAPVLALRVLIVLIVLLSSGFGLLMPGIQISRRTRVSRRGLVIALNVLALPVIWCVGYLSLFLMKGMSVLDGAAAMLLFMLGNGVLRIVLLLHLLLREQPARQARRP